MAKVNLSDINFAISNENKIDFQLVKAVSTVGTPYQIDIKYLFDAHRGLIPMSVQYGFFDSDLDHYAIINFNTCACLSNTREFTEYQIMELVRRSALIIPIETIIDKVTNDYSENYTDLKNTDSFNYVNFHKNGKIDFDYSSIDADTLYMSCNNHTISYK